VPITSASAGSTVSARNPATAAAEPLTAAIRTAGGKPSASRSASSRSAWVTGSQRISACTTGRAASATRITVPSAAVSAAAFSHRRSASCAAARLGRPSSTQPSSSSAAA